MTQNILESKQLSSESSIKALFALLKFLLPTLGTLPFWFLNSAIYEWVQQTKSLSQMIYTLLGSISLIGILSSLVWYSFKQNSILIIENNLLKRQYDENNELRIKNNKLEELLIKKIETNEAAMIKVRHSLEPLFKRDI